MSADAEDTVTRYLRPLLATSDALWPLVARVVAGLVFFSFSFGKFTRHQAEVDAFDRYGIPAADAAVYLVGVLEFVGGLMLIAGLGTRLAALGLAGNMIGAIATAGRIDGGVVHLGLAPALLVTMLVLVWAGAGARSVDRRLSPAP